MVKAMKNKEKYNLNTLKTDSASCGEKIKRMMVYEETSSGIKNLFEKQYTPPVYPYELLVDFANWLETEYKPQILNDVEKAYLSAVIKPFRKNIKYIAKYTFSTEAEYVKICLNCNDYIVFPNFKRGTMYKGMKTNKEYTVEELGL